MLEPTAGAKARNEVLTSTADRPQCPCPYRYMELPVRLKFQLNGPQAMAQ
jgi:hypothetical protein